MPGVDPRLPGTAGNAEKKGGPEKGFPRQMLFIKREFITHLNFTPTD